MAFAAQGNILTGPDSVRQMSEAFSDDAIEQDSAGPAGALAKGVDERLRTAVLHGRRNLSVDALTRAQVVECDDLAGRLMRGLLAGGAAGEGDRRCTVREPGVPADSALIRVDGPSAPLLLISVTNTYPADATLVLLEEFIIWRKANPCPAVVAKAKAGLGVPSVMDAAAHSAAAEDLFAAMLASTNNTELVI